MPLSEFNVWIYLFEKSQFLHCGGFEKIMVPINSEGVALLGAVVLLE